MKSTVALAAALLAAAPAFAHDGGHQHGGGDAAAAAPALPTYAAPQAREIKALSSQEQRGWLEGEGMGLARAAELNGYPGPMHVLELAQTLQLTPEQATATRELMKHHKAEVRRMGAELVDAERQLDTAFRDHHADDAEVVRLTGAIGQLQGRIRASHLQTHLAESSLLTPEQMQRYTGMRGAMR
jgi:Spy/CpxP family protein refolding chaperone